MIRPWFRQAAVPWKTTVTQTRASGENRVSTKPGVLQLVFGVLGAGAPGVGQGLGGGQLGGAGGGRRVAFAGGVGADVVVFGARVGFGLPGPADLGVGVVACLVSGGQRGIPVSMRGAGAVAGSGEGRAGFPADLGELGVCLAADGLGAGISGVGVGAGGVGGLQRGLGVVPGGAGRRGDGLPGLVGSGGPCQGDGGFGLGLAAGGIGCGQRCGDPAGVSGGQLGGGGAGQVSGLGEQLLQASQRAVGRGGLLAGGAGGEAVIVVPLAGACRAAEQAGCAAPGGGGQLGAASGLLAAARGVRGGRCCLIKRAGGDLAGDLAGHGRGLSIFFSAREKKRNEKKIGDEINQGDDEPPRGRRALPRRQPAGRSGPAAAGRVAAAVDDLQPDPGRGGVLGRIPGEPARARAARRGL